MYLAVAGGIPVACESLFWHPRSIHEPVVQALKGILHLMGWSQLLSGYYSGGFHPQSSAISLGNETATK